MAVKNEFILTYSEQVRQLISFLEVCTDSFVWAYNTENQIFSISNEVLAILDLPSKNFTGAVRYLSRIINEGDILNFLHDVRLISAGHKIPKAHIYRAFDKHGRNVMIKLHENLFTIEEKSGKVVIGCIDIVDAADRVKLSESNPESYMKKMYEESFKKHNYVSGFMMNVAVDNFFEINDRLGTAAAAKVMDITAGVCRRQRRNGNELFITNSRNFVLINFESGTAEDIRRIFYEISRDLEEIQRCGKYEIVFTVSAGGIAFFKDKSPFPELVKKLTYSLETAKKSGLHKLSLYDAVQYKAYLGRLELQNNLQSAVYNDFKGFRLYYQPVINARKLLSGENVKFSDCVIGAEALLRWRNDDGELFGAEKIIPVLEESELILPVGKWILQTAFTQCMKWNKRFPEFHMSVNLSHVQIKKGMIIQDVYNALQKSGVNPENIILEITESGQMDTKVIQEAFDELAGMKLKIDIDDFGTGYSNLRYIQNLNANTLKLDYTFIHRAVNECGKDKKIIEYITSMAHDLGMSVCMEGIESAGDLDKLGYMLPDKFQGFLFGRPVNAEVFERDNFL